MRDSRYVNANVTAVCDEPADVTPEQVTATRQAVASWISKQDGLGAVEAAELMKILGVHPKQDDPTTSTAILPKFV